MEQLTLLQSMGITRGQGFLFSQAVALPEFVQQLTIGGFSHKVSSKTRKIG